MIALTGGALVLPDGVVPLGTLVIDEGRIVEVIEGPAAVPGAEVRDVTGHLLVPGFIDVHVHGVAGVDVLDGSDAVAAVAAVLPRYGVTAFCPTSVACEPEPLRTFLDAVRRARTTRAPGSARVLPAHLESNFINPAWSGAQPAGCLRVYRPPTDGPPPEAFDAGHILRAIEDAGPHVGIVTLAPELPGGLALVRRLRAEGRIVSIGHSGATYDETRQAIEAGVTHATHLFNRMSPLHHREPGVVGAVLESRAVTAEVICDGAHVHPALVALAVSTKGADRMLAITDGTAAATLPTGTRARLGGHVIRAGLRTAELEDGTLAGSIITMDQAFRMLVQQARMPLPIAAALCATTAANQLGLGGQGRLTPGARADIVVLDQQLAVRQTWIDGQLVAEP
jgi:N-acetylglucosamine-6-phosphate deacetylase